MKRHLLKLGGMAGVFIPTSNATPRVITHASNKINPYLLSRRVQRSIMLKEFMLKEKHGD